MNHCSNIRRFDPVIVCCLMLLLALHATVNCHPMEENAIEAVVPNGDTDFESSSSNDQQPLIEINRGTVGGRVKRGVSCYAGRAGCISSCYSQGCRNGYCSGGWGGTCICYSC